MGKKNNKRQDIHKQLQSKSNSNEDSDKSNINQQDVRIETNGVADKSDVSLTKDNDKTEIVEINENRKDNKEKQIKSDTEFEQIELSDNPQDKYDGSKNNADNVENGDTTTSDDTNVEGDEQGLDVNSKAVNSERELNPDLESFMTACQQGDITKVSELISSGNIGANDSFSDGITGLHWASINNRLSIVKFLIENDKSKADPNILGGELEASPLHWACRNGLVYIVDYFINNTNADPTLRDSQSYNALHLAVHSSNITLVVYLLLTCCGTSSENSKTLYIDETDNCDRTSLHWAAYQGDLLTINALLKFGADVNKLDKNMFIPLHWAFMKGYKTVLNALVEAGSNIFAKTDQNKNTFDVAKDMNCYDTWTKVLVKCGRDPRNNWETKEAYLNPKYGKLITFFTPYITLPVIFQICSFYRGFIIPKLFMSGVIFGGSIYALQKLVMPTYLTDEKPIPKSPLLAGIFSATAFWCTVTWLINILPQLFLSKFIVNIMLGAIIYLFVWSFFKAMFINPGFVPTPSDNAIILDQVKDLIKIGKFDTDNFCVNSFVRKPLRSKYSKFNKKLIARFDHSCPWVYNDIGVRNHKLFMIFVYSLNFAVLIFTYLSISLFELTEENSGYDSDNEAQKCSILSDELCVGYKYYHFHYNLMIWCLMQYIWIVFLCIVQTFQILKGLTTWEFSSLNNRMQNHNGNNHSTLPNDFNGEFPPVNKHRHSSGMGICFKLIGLDQLFIALKLGVKSIFSHSSSNEIYDPLNEFEIPTDYGLKRNWLDFWFIGEIEWRNLFYLPIEGENNLNGQVVDYYKLYEYPSKGSDIAV